MSHKTKVLFTRITKLLREISVVGKALSDCFMSTMMYVFVILLLRSYGYDFHRVYFLLVVMGSNYIYSYFKGAKELGINEKSHS